MQDETLASERSRACSDIYRTVLLKCGFHHLRRQYRLLPFLIGAIFVYTTWPDMDDRISKRTNDKYRSLSSAATLVNGQGHPAPRNNGSSVFNQDYIEGEEVVLPAEFVPAKDPAELDKLREHFFAQLNLSMKLSEMALLRKQAMKTIQERHGNNKSLSLAEILRNCLHSNVSEVKVNQTWT